MSSVLDTQVHTSLRYPNGDDRGERAGYMSSESWERSKYINMWRIFKALDSRRLPRMGVWNENRKRKVRTLGQSTFTTLEEEKDLVEELAKETEG
jgi:hypothetical protein